LIGTKLCIINKNNNFEEIYINIFDIENYFDEMKNFKYKLEITNNQIKIKKPFFNFRIC
jgi:hypothetical protein